ncbi:MAG: trypsin-like peptidase domain-containing protein, partial [Acidimicrobiaceae bacterium]|nr:trypsin-like peptidase domain-containing protein [Acidimicrobiaceae bacterium]MYK74121.1 trypsin-like peptidase domain-containing protein [Acidimicrobiaceae bacterium]
MVFGVFGCIEAQRLLLSSHLLAVFALTVTAGCTVVESPSGETSVDAPTVAPNASDTDAEHAEPGSEAPTLTAPDDLAMEPVSYLDCDFSDHADHALDAVWQVKAGLSNGTAFHVGDGQWLTAEHVVSGNSAATLHNGGASIRATVVAVNRAGDTALLLTSSGPNRLEFGSLADIGPGHQAYAVGFPLYDAPQASISRGIVSRIERHAGLEDVILTDAAVNPGNSGGPLLNECGQVIGMNVSRLTEDDAAGLNYAIAEPTLRRRVAQLGGTPTGDPTAPSAQRAAPTTTTIPALIEVPDVSGFSYGEADAQLRALGLQP